MPVFNTPIEEIDESIIRPVIFSVAKDIFNQLDLPESVPFMIRGESDQYLYRGSEIQACTQSLDDHNRYEGEPLFYIEADVSDNEMAVFTSPVMRAEERPAFSDKRLAVHLSPAYMSKRVDLNLRVTGTMNQVERWRTTMRRKANQGVLNLHHEITYHYPIPLNYMRLLARIYNMRQAVAPYDVNESLAKWLKDSFIKPYQILNTAKGDFPLFTVCEKQVPIIGWFEYGNQPPKPQKVQDLSLNSLEFTYSFYFDCVETMTMRCPPMIHNQMLPRNFLLRQPPLEVDYVMKEGSKAQEAFENFRYNGEAMSGRLGKVGLPIPWYDDWIEDVNNPSYMTLVKILTSVDLADPYDILNYQALGAWKLNPLLIRYLKATYQKINLPYQNIISISQWRWGELTNMKDLEVSSDLAIRTKVALNPRDLHHHVLSILTDPSRLTDDAIDDLLQHPCLIKTYLSSLFPWTLKYFNWDIEKCSLNPEDDEPWTRPDWDLVIDEIGKHENITATSEKARWNLVAKMSIYAQHKP